MPYNLPFGFRPRVQIKKLWITYAWLDNTSSDVEFLAAELRNAGLDTKLDRWNLAAGKRLWSQIDNFISNPSESDAWLLYATRNSLESEPCREEFAMALDRALRARSESFPVIAVFPDSVEAQLIPAGIRTRLHVSLKDNDWKERVVAAVEGRVLHIIPSALDPFEHKVHKMPGKPYNFVVEVRPRAGVWSPCFVAIPKDEVEQTRGRFPLVARLGPRGAVPKGHDFGRFAVYLSDDDKCTICEVDEECTPTRSLFAYFKKLPSLLLFGACCNEGPRYEIPLGLARE